MISNNKEPFVAVFYSGLVGSIIFSTYSFSHWNTIESNWIWFGLITLGVCGFISHLILVYAIQLSNLSFVANFQYSQLVWSSILGLIIFGTTVEPTRILGMIAIIVFGILCPRNVNTKLISQRMMVDLFKKAAVPIFALTLFSNL